MLGDDRTKVNPFNYCSRKSLLVA